MEHGEEGRWKTHWNYCFATMIDRPPRTFQLLFIVVWFVIKTAFCSQSRSKYAMISYSFIVLSHKLLRLFAYQLFGTPTQKLSLLCLLIKLIYTDFEMAINLCDQTTTPTLLTERSFAVICVECNLKTVINYYFTCTNAYAIQDYSATLCDSIHLA